MKLLRYKQTPSQFRWDTVASNCRADVRTEERHIELELQGDKHFYVLQMTRTEAKQLIADLTAIVPGD
jgi:hypothetical protein